MIDDGELLGKLQDLRHPADEAGVALPTRVNELLHLARELPEHRIDAELLCEFLSTVLDLTSLPFGRGSDSQPRMAADFIGTIAQILTMIERKAGRQRDEVLSLLESALTAFRYAVQIWEEDCANLPPFFPVPSIVERSMAAFLESLAHLERALVVLEYFASQIGWLDPLCQGLQSERDIARKEFDNRVWRARVWILRKRALRLGVGGLAPSLTEVVSEPGEREGEPYSQVSAAARKIDGELTGLARPLMSACIAGKLAALDIELARTLVARTPGFWAKAHWDALHANGFRAPIHLVKQGESVWTEAPAFQVAKREVGPGELIAGVAPLLECPRLLAPSGALTIFKPNETAAPAPEELAMIRRSLPLAGVELEMFGDDEGLWFRAQGHDEVVKGSCGESGNEAELPLLVLGPPDAPKYDCFRAGPLLRPLLRKAGPNVDRAYSPRGYLVPVGEGILRELFGWPPREVGQRLNEAAAKGGITTGEELLRLDLAQLPKCGWLTQIPFAKQIAATLGAECLGDLGWSPERLNALLRLTRNTGTEERINLGPELAALDPAALSEDLRPVDGDALVFMPTATASSLICAGLLRYFLQVWYPSSSINIEPTAVMRQRPGPLQTDHSTSDRPLRDVVAVAQPQLERFLSRGADPVVIATSGLFWQSMASFMLAWQYRVPALYRSEKARTSVAIRTDLFRPDRSNPIVWPERQVPPALPKSAATVDGRRAEQSPLHWLVINVGLSLRNRWRGPDRTRTLPSSLEHATSVLVEWAKKQPGERWRVCSELTAFEAWRRLIRATGALGVALLASDESEPCRRAVGVLLEEMGVQVLVQRDWRVQDFDDFRSNLQPAESVELLRSQTITPIYSCFQTAKERGHRAPHVAIGTGQRMTAMVLFALARLLGCPAFFSENTREGEEPAVWPLQEADDGEKAEFVRLQAGEEAPREPDRMLERILSPAVAEMAAA